MRTKCSLLLLFTVALIHAQSNDFFDYQWKLDQIVTSNETFIAEPFPTYAPPDQSEIEHIYFDEYMGYYSFLFGYHANGGGSVVFDDNNSTLIVSNFANHFGGYSSAEQFFSEEFIIGSNTYPNPQNPFSYQFYTENNMIYLEITNAEGSIATFYDSQLSVDLFSKLHIKIYPNPASGYINIEAVDLIINQVQIYDINGKLVSEIKTDNSPKIDVTNLSSGIYFLRIETDEGSFSKKVIIN